MAQGLGSNFRYPQLDGLRGIAILMVVEHHYQIGATLVARAESSLTDYLEPILSLGWSGVHLFFVLSGFLLGGILLDNKEARNYFKVFYVRRAHRIFPLYFVVVILVLVIMALRGNENSFSSWTYLTFTQNIAMAQDGSLGFAWLAPTWSLAIEEQFYLVLPFFIWLLSKEKLPYLLVVLILFGLLSRLALIFFYPNSSEFAFLWLLPAAGEPLFWGVLGAWMTRNQKCLEFLNSHRKVLYLVLVTLATITYLLALGFPPTYGFTLLGLLYICTLLIAVTEVRGPISFVTRNQLLGKIGVISYGVYLLHLPVSGLVVVIAHRSGLLGPSSEFYINVGALLLTIALGAASWILFEKRIVNWGRSFKYHNPNTS